MLAVRRVRGGGIYVNSFVDSAIETLQLRRSDKFEDYIIFSRKLKDKS
jgi:hypothetical protein